MAFENKKIGDVCTIRRGASPRPIKDYISDEGMPWVKISDATSANSRYLYHTDECIIETGVPKSVTVEPETLIVSNSATPGLPMIMKIKACVHDGWLVFSDFNGVTRDYLYYKFIDIRRSLVNQANGSVFMNLKTDIVRNFDIKVPPIEVQNKIVNILLAIDEKIEKNNQINRNLEEQALLLFKSCFFDYEPYAGVKPETWEDGVLGDFVTIKRGGSPRPIQEYLTDIGLRWLKISDVTNLSSPFVIDIAECIKESGLKKTIYLKAGSLVLSNSATPGIPKILDVDSCIHDGWLYFTESQFSNEFLYLYFKHIRRKLVALGNGSVFTNLKTDILKGYPTVKPERSVLEEFDAIVIPMFDEMRRIARENHKLSELRDALLPKLMSGELDVSDLDI